APASVDRFGESRVNRRYFSDVPVNERYEDVRGSVPSSSSMGGLSGSAYRPPIAGSVQVADHFYFDDDARADLESALSAAVNIAKTEILASHHLNEVTFSTLLNPFVDLGMTVAVDAQTITATGTVGKLVETYDIASGRAHSEISVNVYGPNISGQSETGALPPARPDVAPALVSDDIPLGTHLGGLPNSPAPSAEWRGFLGNYSAANSAAFDAFRYPHEFRIETPGVDDALRLIASAERSSRYTVAIPQESISIIA
ncbi:hypothetical protein, partial [Methylophaga lonarensis]|uniref:hypothetical protein n=1 Tax=Methylophaga lonarensis TaxID=999151 RepID=UPI003D275C53